MATKEPQNENANAQAEKPSRIKRVRDFKLYPRAHEAHLSIHEPAIRTSRLALLRAAFKNFVFLQTLFFALFCYIFGALYKQNGLIHHFNVAFVDYDGGAVGEAVRAAYTQLQGNSFPTLQEKSPSEYPLPSDLRDEVCHARYWATLYIYPGASAAIQSWLTEGAPYDEAHIMEYIWNEAQYPAIIDSGVSSNLQRLSAAAYSTYATQTNWSSIIPQTDATTFATFAKPWTLSNENIQPTSQGSRIVYNTLVIILLMIQEFFYLGTLNQLYDMFKIYKNLNPHRIILFRTMISVSYCFIGSLCVTGAIWIFKTGWDVNGTQFVLTWFLLWLYAHLTFLTLDVFTVWLPPPFVPMALISWLMMNVVSILVPFELMSDFYKWSYAMPAHNVYNVLIDIWSRGCNPVLRYALPILFAYEVSSFIIAAIGIHRRCHYAIVRAEAEQRAMEQRIESALVFDREKRAEEKAKFHASPERVEPAHLGDDKSTPGGGDSISSSQNKADAVARDEDARDRAELKRMISKDLASEASLQNFNFGPSFGFGFTSGNMATEKEKGDEEAGAALGRSWTVDGLGWRNRRRGSLG